MMMVRLQALFQNRNNSANRSCDRSARVRCEPLCLVLLLFGVVLLCLGLAFLPILLFALSFLDLLLNMKPRPELQVCSFLPFLSCFSSCFFLSALICRPSNTPVLHAFQRSLPHEPARTARPDDSKRASAFLFVSATKLQEVCRGSQALRGLGVETMFEVGDSGGSLPPGKQGEGKSYIYIYIYIGESLPKESPLFR